LVPAEEFAARYPHPISIQVIVPNDPSNAAWNLHGQAVQVLISVTAAVKDLKDILSNMLGGMPGNKQVLKTPMAGFLKDTQTLAALNLGDGAVVELQVKTRGGAKR
jgi:splicing factor 3A subunit 1